MKMKKGIAVALTAAILTSGGGVTAGLATATPALAASSQNEIDVAIAQIHKETNAERAKVGLPPLKLAPSMNEVAQGWSEQMASNKSMTHNPDYQFTLPTPWMRVGENVGQGYTTSTIVAAWMASPGHKANIVGDFTHIGLGYWVDDTGRAWFTQNFGKYATVENPSVIDTPTNKVTPFEITSSWTPRAGEVVDDYSVELYSANGTLLMEDSVRLPTFTFTGLNPLTEYIVKVTAHATDATGLTYISPVKTYKVSTLEDLPIANAPANLTTSVTDSSVTAHWENPSSIRGVLQPYRVELRKGTQLLKTVTTDSDWYEFYDLPSNTDYTVTVITNVTHNGKSASASAVKSAKTILSSIADVSEAENVVATAPNHSSINVAWDAPDYIRGINLKYKLVLQGDGKTVTAETTSRNHTFTGLKSSTPYEVIVQASVDSEDGTNNLTTDGVTSYVETPEDQSAVATVAPTLEPVLIESTQAAMYWAEPSAYTGTIASYTVAVKQAGKVDRIFTTTDTYLEVSGLSENMTYTFEVRANAVSLDGKNRITSAAASATVKTPYAATTAIVSSPLDLALQAPTYNQINATWNAPSVLVGTLLGYDVTLMNESGTVISTKRVTTRNVTFTGLTDSTFYTVKVVAKVTSADGSNTVTSNASSLNKLTPAHLSAPNPPSSFKTSNITSNDATVSWLAPTGVYGLINTYTVTLKEAGKANRTFTTYATNWKLTGLTENTAYTVTVVANVMSQDGSLTGTTPAATLGMTTSHSPNTVIVSAPTNVRATATHATATATWNTPVGTVGNLTGYTVTLKQGSTVKGTYTTTGTSYTLNGLESNTAYTVSVKANATSANGLNKAISADTTVNTLTAKSPIVNVTAPVVTVSGVTFDRGTVAWTKPVVTGSITGYTVLVRSGSTSVKSVTIPATALSTIVTGLDEDTDYSVAVVANAVSENGSNSAQSSSTLKALSTTVNPASVVTVATPTALLLDSTETGVTATWKAPAVTGKIVGYSVVIKQGSTVKGTYTTTGTSYSINGLELDTAYTVEVKANAVSANGTKIATSTAAISSVSTKKSSAVSVAAPVVTVSGVNFDRGTVTWTKPAVTGTITGYTVVVKAGSTVVKTVPVSGSALSTLVTGLSENTDYTVTVEAAAIAANGVNVDKATSVAQSFKTVGAPVTVAAPVATVSAVAFDRATVSWTKPATTGTITGYTVVVKAGSTVVKTVPASGSTLSTVVTGLSENTDYTVTVEATAVAANSTLTAEATSVAQSFKTTVDVNSIVKVNPITVFPISVSSSSVFTSWKAPSVTGKISSYTVTLKQGSTVVKTVTTTGTTTSFMGLAENTAYTVEIKANAVSANGKNKASSTTLAKSVKTSLSAASTVKVGVPTSVAGSATYNTVTATWKKPSVTGIVSGYTVVLKQGTRTIKTVNTTGLTYRFTGLTEKTGYTVYVKASAKSANGKYSASSAYGVKNVTTGTSAASTVRVSAPTYTKTSSTYNTVSAWWNKPSVTGTVASYTVVLKHGSKYIKTVTTTSLSYKFTGLTEKTGYTVYVKANAKSANGKYSASSAYSVKNVTTGTSAASTVRASAPTYTKASSTYNTVSAWWKKPSVTGSLTNYTVVLKHGSKYIKTVNTTSLSYKFTGLSEKTGYTVYVKANAKSANKKYSASSSYSVRNVTTATTAASTVRVSAPAFTKTSATYNSISAYWKKPSYTGRLTGYTITLKQGSKTIKSVTTTSLSYKFTGLKKGTSYSVQVKANATSSNKKYKASSSTTSRTVKTSLDKASIVSISRPVVSASSNTSTVTASWKKPSVAGSLTGYTVTLKQGSKTIKTVTTTKLKYSFTRLKEGTNYTVYVRANGKSPNGQYKGYSSTASKVIKTKLTAASTVKVGKPSSVKVYSGTSHVSAYWKKPYVYGKLVNYTVTVKLGNKTVKSYTTTSLKRSITGLKRNTTYKVYVKANAKSSNGKYKASSAYVYKSIKTKR